MAQTLDRVAPTRFIAPVAFRPTAADQQIEYFLAHLGSEKRFSSNTLSAYRNDLRQLRRFLIDSGVSDWSVEPATVLGFVFWLKEKEYATASMARKLAATKTFFAYLRNRGLIEADPAAHVGSPRVGRSTPKTITVEEVDRLLSAPAYRKTQEAARDGAMFALLYATGMRVTELVSLDVTDINPDDATITCTGRAGRRRVIKFDERTLTALREYLTSARAALLRGGSETALFLNHRGDRLTRQGFWLLVKSYASEAGIASAITPHTIRHSFAAHMLGRGMQLREVQQKLGHANISTTQVYRQVRGAEVAAS